MSSVPGSSGFAFHHEPKPRAPGMIALGRKEEEALMKEMKARARKVCEPQVSAYAECVTGRTITIPFVCGDLLKEMQACMKPLCSDQEMDKYRMDFLSDEARTARRNAPPEARDGSHSPYAKQEVRK